MNVDATYKNVMGPAGFFTETVEDLLANGANPKITDVHGDTLLGRAARYSYKQDIYVLLIQAFAKTGKFGKDDFSDELSNYLTSKCKEKNPFTEDDPIIEAFLNVGSDLLKASCKRTQRHFFEFIASWSPEGQIRLITNYLNREKLTKSQLMDILAHLSSDKEKALTPEVARFVMKACSKAPDEYENEFLNLIRGKLSQSETTTLANKPKAKEKLIAFIQSQPLTKRAAILSAVFAPSTKVHYFFSTSRSWMDLFATEPDSDLWAILRKMWDKSLAELKTSKTLLSSEAPPPSYDSSDSKSGSLAP